MSTYAAYAAAIEVARAAMRQSEDPAAVMAIASTAVAMLAKHYAAAGAGPDEWEIIEDLVMDSLQRTKDFPPPAELRRRQ